MHQGIILPGETEEDALAFEEIRRFEQQEKLRQADVRALRLMHFESERQRSNPRQVF